MQSHFAMMMPERGRVTEWWKTAPTGRPTESEIATVAYQLWRDNGCPVGSDKEDWFRAEAMLKNAFVEKGQDLPARTSVPCDDNYTEFEMLAEFRWEGHWVVWESEWAAPRWIRELATRGDEVSHRAA